MRPLHPIHAGHLAGAVKLLVEATPSVIGPLLEALDNNRDSPLAVVVFHSTKCEARGGSGSGGNGNGGGRNSDLSDFLDTVRYRWSDDRRATYSSIK